MNTHDPTPRLSRGGYMLIECLVYISVVMILVGVGYAAMYKCIQNSTALRRSAADINSAVRAGERWRADLRAATAVSLQEGASPTLTLRGASRTVVYQLREDGLYRRLDEGPWVPVLQNVQASTMRSDSRSQVAAWRWDLELKPRTKNPKVRPLFTFVAVPAKP